MNQKIDLCAACAATMETGYKLVKVKGGRDNKVLCAQCGRKRYGATYELRSKTEDTNG